MRHKAVNGLDRSAVPHNPPSVVIAMFDLNDPASVTHRVRGRLPTVVFDFGCKLPGVWIALLTLGVFITTREAGRKQ